MPNKKPLGLTAREVDIITDALNDYQSRRPHGQPASEAWQLLRRFKLDVPVFPCYLLAWPGVSADELAPMLADDSQSTEPTPPRNGPGLLEVGTTTQNEVVINLPRDMTGHIALSSAQAEHLAAVLIKQAAYATAQANPPPLECPECGNPTGERIGKVCTSPGCPLVKAGLCVTKEGDSLPHRGCAACDRGDFTIGHADHCPVSVLRKMADRTAARIEAEQPQNLRPLTPDESFVLSTFIEQAAPGNPLELHILQKRMFEEVIACKPIGKVAARKLLAGMVESGLLYLRYTSENEPVLQMTGKGLALIDQHRGAKAGEAKLAGKYPDPGPVRGCPVCNRSGNPSNMEGVVCRTCEGLGEVLVNPRVSTHSLLTDAMHFFRNGDPAKTISIFAQLFVRLESQSNRLSNEASMRANGIIPD